MKMMRKNEDPDPSLIEQFIAANNYNKLPSPLWLSWLLMGLFTSSFSYAGNSANFGISSNYLWRGISQSNKNIADSGGLDYAADSGVYLGTWASTMTGGSYELDLYSGFSTKVNDVSYDVGVISYQYPNDNDYFNELYFSTGVAGFTANLAYTFGSKDNSSANFSSGDVYYSLAYSHAIAVGVELSASLGHYDFDDVLGDDYNHYNISASKSDFTLALDTTSALSTNNDTTLSLAWVKSFDL